MTRLVSTMGRVIQDELRLAYRQRDEWMQPALFFVIVVTLFPLGTVLNPAALHKMGPGIIWVAALLANFLALGRLFQLDYEDGSLMLLLISPVPLPLLVLAKLVAHWVISAVPLLLLSPLMAVLLHFSGYELLILWASLLLGTPLLTLIGAMGAGLTVGLRQGGLLLALLILPLSVPVLIFATGSVMDASMGLPIAGQLALLGAMLALALGLVPISVSAILKVSVAT